MNNSITSDISISITTDYLLQLLYTYRKKHKYYDIYTCMSYIHTMRWVHNKYHCNKTKLDKYITGHSIEHINKVLQTFYTSIIIYNFMIRIHKKKHKVPKQLLNDDTLCGESILECSEPIIYIKHETQPNKYYAFTCSELNKIITNALLPTFTGVDIIPSQYPKQPWTNEVFTPSQLEYILYKFKYHSIHYHKIITMFSDSNLNLQQFCTFYDIYLDHVSTLSYIRNLNKKDFKILFNSLWCLLSCQYPELRTRMCKKCILKIQNIQTILIPIMHIYFSRLHDINNVNSRVKRILRNLKNQFTDIFISTYPHVFKNKDYYHLHYSKYNRLRVRHKPFFSLSLPLPIHGFTNDCKIIYDCKGTLCTLEKQVLVAI